MDQQLSLDDRADPIDAEMLAELRACERDIAAGLEHFYMVGMRLKRIKEGKLYEAAGFENWKDYLRLRWDWGETYGWDLINSATYRAALPGFANCETHQWTESQVRELCRLGTPKRAAKVAHKIVANVEGDEPVTLTAAYVRQIVDAEMGSRPVRTAPAARPPLVVRDDLAELLANYTDEVREMQADLRRQMPRALTEDQADAVQELADACDVVSTYLRAFHSIPL